MSRAIIVPARSKHILSVIFVHGLGDSGAGWSFLPELFAAQRQLEGVKWILPNAPNSPVTLNGGFKMPSWYDIKSLEDINQLEDEEGMKKSAKLLHDLFEQEIQTGLRSEQIIIAGFSQGCAMSLLAGLSDSKPLAGIIGLSGYLPLRHKLREYASTANHKTRVWLGHGTADPVVNFKYGKASAEALSCMGMSVTWNEYSGVGHTADPKEIQDLAIFLEQTLENVKNI